MMMRRQARHYFDPSLFRRSLHLWHVVDVDRRRLVRRLVDFDVAIALRRKKFCDLSIDTGGG